MARPYKDAVELAVEPVPDRKSPFTPADAVIVRGVYTPGVPGVAPLVLLPDYEYRVRQVGAPHTETECPPDEQAWVIERRRAPS